ncbi:amidohydrolase [Haematobacter massiliensis]|uniref:Amidohydrolase n=3 Tax=Haematobacter massiliensis TaxID=195105 RepID=A0A086Y7R7_9RHOB|nr:M20 aminoacylase family protein [Haematobacter massiliensis]KFI30317.1 amidohydrolase [Haematobacter massiliensis]OWJ70536.1 amidohydrolase [Haematobacter massiliensis]OWJ87324.1 amidohydrolase [Haematobacter massiliensis]QBJ24776.1 amidohydrolase [Haematobacter massiliensis]
MPIKNRLAELQEEIAAWRRDFHENPELMYDVHRTAGIVAEKLREFGCDEVVEGIGRTGVVGIIRGRSGSDRVIGLRADMDALPIYEVTGLPYASRVPGKMHACGHDGHTAMLLGAAKYLAETRNFDGTVALIFQPAEEGGAGGKAMVDDGMIERFGITEAYGMHNSPGLEVGKFSIRSGPFYAATDEFEITVTGKGGHAAKPHASIDTTLIASHIIIALQSIASRNADPIKSIVVSVTSFRTETEAFNVIPERVTLRGTIRTFEKELRALGEERLKALVPQIAGAFGGSAEIDWRPGYPATVNWEAETTYAAEAARTVAGDVDTNAEPLMGGEDFSYVLEVVPGAYIQIGNGDSADVHHPAYNFNDEAIPAGASFWAELVEQRLRAA